MGKHARAADGGQDLLCSCVCSSVSSSFDFDPVFNKLFVIFVEPTSSRGIIGQEANNRYDGYNRDEALDDEKPTEALKTAVAVKMANTIGYTATKGTSSCRRREDDSNPERAFFDGIPEGYQEDDTLISLAS